MPWKNLSKVWKGCNRKICFLWQEKNYATIDPMEVIPLDADTQAYIYIVFSATPYFIGKAIRCITGEIYNHASIALDEDLTRMYGFSRRYYRTPLYGGFVRESLSRYHLKGKRAHIRICRLSVTQTQYHMLETLLEDMHANRQAYIYNHLSALGTLLHRPVKAKQAYTCIEFCIKILYDLGIDVDPNRYYSVGQVEQQLRHLAIYTGPVPASSEYDSAYFAKKPITHPARTTCREILKLIPRLGA